MDTAPESVFEAVKAYLLQAPAYHIALEAILVSWILYLLFFSKQYRPESKHDKLTKEEEEQLIAEWQPGPLVPNVYPNDREDEPSPIVTGTPGTYITVDGKRCLNFATYNFLGLLGNEAIKESAANSIKKYGVGSCGPRGFYGTIDVHLKLEEQLAEFTGREEAILYSYGFAAISSCIPAYSKRRDIIFCDEGVSFPIQKGVTASRSKVKLFKHNDMDDLERLLEEQRKLDEKNPAKAKVTRKFIIAEALYMNYGDLVPLTRMVELRNKYRVPIILEESLSFGVLGEKGRGATEHFGVSVDDVDLISVSLDMSVASMGGFVAGKTYIIDHQRLSGIGYCFSASMPPMMSVAAVEALGIMDRSPEMFGKLRSNAEMMRKLLNDVPGLTVQGYSQCPVIHLHLSQPSASRDTDQELLHKVATECVANGVAVTSAKYLEEMTPPPPSIRLTVSSEHTEDELSQGAKVIREAAAKFLT